MAPDERDFCPRDAIIGIIRRKASQIRIGQVPALKALDWDPTVSECASRLRTKIATKGDLFPLIQHPVELTAKP